MANETRLWITSGACLEVEALEDKAEKAGEKRKEGTKTVVATNVSGGGACRTAGKRAPNPVQANEADKVETAGNDARVREDGLADDLPRASCKVAFAVVEGEKDGGAVMAACAKLVRPEGTVYVQAKQGAQGLLKAALLAGLVQARVEEGDGTWLVAKTPAWEVGASAPLRVRVDLADEAEEELVDEDELLTEADRLRPEPQARGCNTARKACANCSCGRAEAEEKAMLKGEDLVDNDVPVSACGSCGLGDAFRCGTCPYRGLPPFKPGEKVSINQSVLAADI